MSAAPPLSAAAAVGGEGRAPLRLPGVAAAAAAPTPRSAGEVAVVGLLLAPSADFRVGRWAAPAEGGLLPALLGGPSLGGLSRLCGTPGDGDALR